MANNNLVYLSYGNESEYRRAIFSIISFSSWAKSSISTTRIILYTDNPDFFYPFFPDDLPIEYFLLTNESLDEMLAGTGFIHRRKIAIIDLTFKQYPDDNLLFIDSDTFFIADPKSLFEEIDLEKSLMHKREYALKDAPQIFGVFNQAHYPNAFLDYIADKTFEIGGSKESFDGDDYSWNAGFLGLHKDFAKYLPDIYKLTDNFYLHSKWFVCEQLAFALALQRKTEIASADSFILHYWGKRQKVLMDNLLIDLFSSSKANAFSDIFIKSLTLKWDKKIANDMILEQAVIALSSSLSLYGLKNCLLVMFRNPFDSGMYKELLRSLKPRLSPIS